MDNHVLHYYSSHNQWKVECTCGGYSIEITGKVAVSTTNKQTYLDLWQQHVERTAQKCHKE